MAKINELTYDVREAIKEYSDDSEIDDRYILFLYDVKRAKYLRQDLNNYQKSTDTSIQQTFCVELKEVSANECSVNLSCDKILRSTVILPTPLELHTKVALTKVKPINVLGIPFTFITKERVPYMMASPYSKGVYAFLDPNGYLYVTSNSDITLLECLTVTGIFEDPVSLKDYKNCCNCNDNDNACFDEATTDYPLQPHYIDLIRKEIIQELTIGKQNIEDKDNNATDS